MWGYVSSDDAGDGSSFRKSDKLWNPKENRPLDLFDQAKLDSPDWTVLVDGRPMKKLPFAHEGLIRRFPVPFHCHGLSSSQGFPGPMDEEVRLRISSIQFCFE